MNVICKMSFLIIGFGASLLLGCKDPEVSVSSLGKKMSAPQLKGSSPFDQDFHTQKYVRLQGACDSRVDEISVSFDNQYWFVPPSTPNYTDTSLTGSETNDISCYGDGAFDIYLAKQDLLGHGIDPDNNNVDFIYIRGSTLIGETQVLTLKDPTPGGGSGSDPATKIIVSKNGSIGFAGSSQCEGFTASLRNAQNENVTSVNAVTFELDKKVAATIYPKVYAFSNLNDCNLSLNTTNTFSIPANQNNVHFYYKFPASPIGDTFYLRAGNVALSTTTSDFISMILRDSTDSTRFWITSYSPSKVVSGVCARANYTAKYYSGAAKTLGAGSYAFVPVVSGGNSSNLQFYSDESCSTNAYAISAGAVDNAFYFKYTGAEIDTNLLDLSLNHSTDAGDGTADDIAHNIFIDRSNDLTVKSFQLMGPNEINRGNCQKVSITSHNSKGALLGASNQAVTLAASGAGNFFASESNCQANINSLSSTTLASTYKNLYLKSTATPDSSEVFTATGSAAISQARLTAKISNRATKLQTFVNGTNTFPYPTAGGCQSIAIQVKLTDQLLDGVYYANNFGTNIDVNINIPSGYTFYSNATCTDAPLSFLNLPIAPGMSSTGITGWIKADSSPSGGIFNIYTPANPSYSFQSELVNLNLY